MIEGTLTRFPSGEYQWHVRWLPKSRPVPRPFLEFVANACRPDYGPEPRGWTGDHELLFANHGAKWERWTLWSEEGGHLNFMAKWNKLTGDAGGTEARASHYVTDVAAMLDRYGTLVNGLLTLATESALRRVRKDFEAAKV